VTSRGRAAVFLDRDGVLNESLVEGGVPHPPASTSDVRIASGATLACERLRASGFVLAVVTNQPDISRGATSAQVVAAINDFVGAHVPVDSFWTCPHDDRDGCDCRKPLPGLLQRAARFHDVDLQSSFMVGDRWRDIDAGRAAGCRTVLIHDPRHSEAVSASPDFVAADIVEAAAWIADQSVSTWSSSAGGM
jgi:D-glycero-D-manno-heptose 1,7-bisphosphate phosphatase